MTQQDNERRRPILKLKKSRDRQRQQVEDANADLMIEANLGDEADMKSSGENERADHRGKPTPLQIGKPA